MKALLLLLLTQTAPQQVIIVDPSTRPATNTGSSSTPIKVNCVSGCSAGSGAPTIVTIDGGTTYVTQPNAAALNATVVGTVAATQSGTWTDTPRTVASANNAGVCVSVTASSTNVLASNSSRRGYAFKAPATNTAVVYCKLGATATSSNTPFEAGASWSQDTGAVYTGVVDCISASGTQTVCPYEFN